MNQNQFCNNNPCMNEINNINNMLIQNQYLIMNQMNLINQMNNRLFQDMNMNVNMDNNINFTNNNEINVKFKMLNQSTISTLIKLDEKIATLISKFKLLSGDTANNKEFYFSNKKLCEDLTVAEQGLTNNCEIQVKIVNNETHEEKSEFYKRKKEGIFNELKSGINVLGICSNKKCTKNNKEVISYYKDDKFELINNLYDIMCPFCSCIIIPKKIAFYKCNFIISGKKLDGEFVVPFALNRVDINDNDYFYIFNPDFDKNTTYIELLCNIYNKY